MMLINKCWETTDFLGSGATGVIFNAKHKDDNTKRVAIKLFNEGRTKQYTQELKVHELLVGVPGFTNIHDYGKDNEQLFIVMDLLGSDLYNSNEHIENVYVQMLHRLRDLHSKGIVHNDVKQSNFVYNRENTIVYLIDFDISSKYTTSLKPLDVKNTQPILLINGIQHIQIEMDPRVPIKGTYKYSSVNVLRGISPSPRDDLESLGYVIISMIKELPWNTDGIIKRKDKIKFAEEKAVVDLESLTANTIPGMFEYMKIVRNLDYYEIPPYDKLEQLLNKNN